MRPIDADFLLYYIKDIEVSGFRLKSSAVTDFFRRSFAEIINDMPTLTATEIANGYSKNCPVCGRPLEKKEDA